MSKTYAEIHGIRSKYQILDEDCWRFLEKHLQDISFNSDSPGKWSISAFDDRRFWWTSKETNLKDAVKQAIMEVQAF